MMSELKAYPGFKLVKNRGITAIIVNSGKVLVLKRISLPFHRYSGIWTFVSGGTEKVESFEESAYREIGEEVRIGKQELVLLAKYPRVLKFEANSRAIYPDALFVFNSKTRKIRLNFEHTAYRWASVADIALERRYTNTFADPAFILKVIRKALER